jgi:hypothetical protein
MSTITVPGRNETSASPDFERIFREHGALVYRTAYAVMGNREDADDVLQTVFLRLLRREFPPDLEKNPGSSRLFPGRRRARFEVEADFG